MFDIPFLELYRNLEIITLFQKTKDLSQSEEISKEEEKEGFYRITNNNTIFL